MHNNLKKFMVMLESKHEYDIIVNDESEAECGTEYILYRSNSGWADHVKGEKVLTVTDTGDNYKIDFVEGAKPKNTLDYSQAVELGLLLKLTYTHSVNSSSYTIIPIEEVIEY